jgi:hypothetical protein
MKQTRLLMSIVFSLTCGALGCEDASETSDDTGDEYAAQLGGRPGEGRPGRDGDEDGDEARRPRFPFGDGGWERPDRDGRRGRRDGGLGRGRDRDRDGDEEVDEDAEGEESDRPGPGRRRRPDAGRPGLPGVPGGGDRPAFPGGDRPGFPRGPRSGLDGGIPRP